MQKIASPLHLYVIAMPRGSTPRASMSPVSMSRVSTARVPRLGAGSPPSELQVDHHGGVVGGALPLTFLAVDEGPAHR